MKIPEYKDLTEKEKAFGNHYNRITTIKEFNDLFIPLNSVKEIAYRGVCDAKYKNFTSAQRKYMVNDFHTKSTNIMDLIQKQIESVRREHKNLLGKYYKSLNIQPNDFLYLGIAQHYGGISPLLDFTTDLKTALFFTTDGAIFPSQGIDDIGNYSSLYYIPISELESLNVLLNEVTKKVSRRIEALIGDDILDLRKNDDIIELLADFDHFKTTYGISPLFIPNNRTTYSIKIKGQNKMLNGVFSISNLSIVAQKGCFVFYMPAVKNSLQPFETPLYCIDIHKSLIPYINEYTRLKRSDIYPDEYELVKDSCNKALRNILN